jgi:hypothetical protein
MVASDELKAPWERTERHLRAALAHQRLPPDATAAAAEFIEHNELGVAFEYVVSVLDERGIALDAEARESFAAGQPGLDRAEALTAALRLAPVLLLAHAALIRAGKAECCGHAEEALDQDDSAAPCSTLVGLHGTVAVLLRDAHVGELAWIGLLLQRASDPVPGQVPVASVPGRRRHKPLARSREPKSL